MDHPVAARIEKIGLANSPITNFLSNSTMFERARLPGANDFILGNPQDMPLPSLVDALTRAAQPQDKNWFAYRMSEPESREIIASSLQKELGIPFEPADIAMTTGAFGALAAAIQTVIDPGDEVIINLPPWFLYEGMLAAAGGIPVKVAVDPDTFDLDLDAIAEAITPRTRAIIVNSPNNPTGKIYPPATLERLAEILMEGSRRNGRRIYLISDEPYRKLVFDGAQFTSPVAYYRYAMMTYSYGKVLLAPGQRIGYLALSPEMPDREVLRRAIEGVQFSLGFLFPNAILQHALADLEGMSIDMDVLTRKRDRMVAALSEIGYDVRGPEGTFYLLPRSPIADDAAFIEILADHNVFCLPGAVLQFPGFFRISITASEEMIERSLPGFRAAFSEARSVSAA